MSASYAEINKPTHFKITVSSLGKLVCALPVFATFFCVGWSVAFDFDASTRTHCKVPNFLPSISSAIGGFTPQRYIWRICIALHCAPRFMAAIAYYSFHTSIHLGAKNQLYKTLAAIASLLHVCENFALITLSYISSTENHGLHEMSFILFMIFSIAYMMVSIYIFSWGRTANGRAPTHIEKKSLRLKIYLFLFNVSVFMFAVYLFFRHNRYCESGVFSAFAACEYLTVLSNIAFHSTIMLDFEDFSLVLANKELVMKVERKEPK